MHDVEKILKFENPFVQNFYLNYSLRNIELNIHLPFNSMYFETMLQSVTGRPLYSICCIWGVLSRVVVSFVVVGKKFTLEKDIEKI